MVRFSNNIKGSDRNVNIIKHSFSFSKWWEERKNKRDIRKSKLSIILSSGKIIDTLYDLENSLLSNDEDKFKSAYQTLNSAYRYFKGLLHRSYVIYIDKRKALGEVEAVPMPLLPAASLGKDNEGPELPESPKSLDKKKEPKEEVISEDISDKYLEERNRRVGKIVNDQESIRIIVDSLKDILETKDKEFIEELYEKILDGINSYKKLDNFAAEQLINNYNKLLDLSNEKLEFSENFDDFAKMVIKIKSFYSKSYIHKKGHSTLSRWLGRLKLSLYPDAEEQLVLMTIESIHKLIENIKKFKDNVKRRDDIANIISDMTDLKDSFHDLMERFLMLDLLKVRRGDINTLKRHQRELKKHEMW